VRLRVELGARREADAELEALWTSVAWVRDLVLESADGPSSLAASLSTVAELFKGWIDAATTDGVHWGSHSTLVAVVLHFPELETELEVLGSGCSVDLIEDEVDALWTRVRTASDSLGSHVPSFVARNPPDGVG
jgi:hypothetical protein